MAEREGLVRLAREREARERALASIDRRPGSRAPRERLADVLDDGTLFEIAAMATSQLEALAGETPSDGVIAGFGHVGGREVAVIADDAEVIRRSDGMVGRNKRLRLLMHAVHGRVPVLYLADGGGFQRATIDLAEGQLLGRYTDRTIVVPELEVSGREAPMVSVLLGDCAGQEANLVLESDVVVAVRGAGLSANPGSAAEAPGADIVVDDETEALRVAAAVLGLLPEQRTAPISHEGVAGGPPAAAFGEGSGRDLSAAQVLNGLFDAESRIPWETPEGEALHLGLARLEGYPVLYALGDEGGIGTGDLQRLQRLSRLAGRLALPVLLIQHGAAYDDRASGTSAFVRELAATVRALHDAEALPIVLVTRAGHTLGDFVLGGRELGIHYTMAWPAADLALDDLPAFTQTDAARLPGRGPWDAAGLAIVDDVVEPAETRARIAAMLSLIVRARDYPRPHTDRDGRIPFR